MPTNAEIVQRRIVAKLADRFNGEKATPQLARKMADAMPAIIRELEAEFDQQLHDLLSPRVEVECEGPLNSRTENSAREIQ